MNYIIIEGTLYKVSKKDAQKVREHIKSMIDSNAESHELSEYIANKYKALSNDIPCLML